MRYLDEEEKLALGRHLRDYLIETGCATEVQLARGQNFPCPDPGHADNSPSAHYYESGPNGAGPCVYCFGCRNTWDLFKLIGVRENLPAFSQQVERARELYGNGNAESRPVLGHQPEKKPHPEERPEPPPEERAQIEAYLARCRRDLGETDYWQKRGIARDFAERAGLGYDKKEKRLVIPTDTAYVARAIEDNAALRYKNPKGIAVALSGAAELKEAGTVYVVEGALDALAVRQAGGRAIALNGISNAPQVVELAAKWHSPAHIVVALDSDKPGRDTGQKLAAELCEQGFDAQLALSAWEPCKDAGEWLEVGGTEVLARTLTDMAVAEEAPEKDIGQTDAETYRQMYERLKEHKPEHARGDLLAYWEKVTAEIREAAINLHQAQKFCQVLDLWSRAIDQAAREFDFQQEELAPVRRSLADISAKAEQELADWRYIYGTAEKLDKFTRDLMDRAAAARRLNPMLALPEVQHAGKLEGLLAEMEDKIALRPEKHEAIYYAAVRQVTRTKQGLGVYEADKAIVPLLAAQGVGKNNLAGILACSPRLAHLDKAQRLVDSQHFLASELPQKEREREGRVH